MNKGNKKKYVTVIEEKRYSITAKVGTIKTKNDGVVYEQLFIRIPLYVAKALNIHKGNHIEFDIECPTIFKVIK